jgi:hypothetical protein
VLQNQAGNLNAFSQNKKNNYQIRRGDKKAEKGQFRSILSPIPSFYCLILVRLLD